MLKSISGSGLSTVFWFVEKSLDINFAFLKKESVFSKLERYTLSIYIIELLNNKLHELSPPGGSVSPPGGFASLLFDQGVP